MSWIAALFLVAAFLLLANALRIPAHAREVIARSRRAALDYRDPALDERARERAVQGHAVRLLGLFVLVTVCAGIALGVPLGVLALLDAAEVVALDEVIAITVSVPFLVGTLVGGVVVWQWARARSRRV